MTTQPTEQTIRAVAAAISRAEIHDDRMTSDPARLRVWAEACQPHGITDTALACRAVDEHYTRPDADTLRVGTFVGTYRRLRAIDAETDKGAAVAALPAGDPQSGGLPIAAEGEPVWAAYDQHGAIDLPCETCGAGEREACVNLATNLTRKIPCTSRTAHGYRKVRR